MTSLGWFLSGILLGIFIALYHEPAIEVGEVQASWTGPNDAAWKWSQA